MIIALLNKIFSLINRKGSIFFVAPCAPAFGNCAEEIYYALLKARREGKRVVLLYYKQLRWKFQLGISNQELLEVKSPFLINHQGLFFCLSGGVFFGGFFFYVFIFFCFLCVVRLWWW